MSTRGKRSERGASAVEVGLLVAGVALAIIAPAQALALGIKAFDDHCAAPVIEKGYTDPAAGEQCPGD